MKKLLRKFVPESIILLYHKTLAVLANVFYGFPSRRLKVIGVTGTNGKTTTCNLIWEILTEAGNKVGLTTSINFKIADKSWINRTKQGMQGRFRLQKLLREMVKAGCQYAVIETTSEGIKQYRHWGINYQTVVFTNLTPEHIESHGSFEKYKEAKGRLFAALKGQELYSRLLRHFAPRNDAKKVSVVNLDDEQAEYFVKFEADEKWGYGVKSEIRNPKSEKNFKNQISNFKKIIATDCKLLAQGSEFDLEYENQKYHFKTNLLGEFNIYNCLAAIAVGLLQGVEIKIIQQALEKMVGVPGRMEVIYDSKRDITVIVDYAHDPAALEKVYETILSVRGSGYLPSLASNSFASLSRGSLCSPEARPSSGKHPEPHSSIIAVLGAVGGGRDKAKRPKLGSLAAKYAKYVIITNEDPYDDDPAEIMNQVEVGVKSDLNRQINQNYWKILDRRKAIEKAVALAKPKEVIVLTGKGCEEVMAVRECLVPWDDRAVVRQVLGIA
ncbi:MAG: hypothetical protein A2445_02560 [Candidatus Jacksonbacteria bacterium RIFOXYC2_FULL_44_29]|nr:MAG: UDP-N-acetylmuramoyl-L-alanyl-D-glutamate-2,6-diaminopimelate ligase [Parcubacteria group bacterium GW2011_GWA2_42_28]KKT55885.1 MAG: UDP-N-acetylmuramoyl-L-alanyl-D-glutamate-2,6-diaminopimelate ligase [Parcubacteria group bacterium GW2011_GWC2_44_22]OGY74499.1 MAG: hypothetical protein A2240_02820 [Candidatus Jacksonbacteria bacterium RIFOXYA2_FULL_43_12]OGY77408.1 MAG: hypothetical protein A2295_01770 [Candidatus Jacksonbacteria bacterium RIFOXYB2_FULL_44_15]OGY78180.1 MAG: hypotheti